MYSPTHVAVGATLALSISNPALAVGAAVMSHYILDSIPHGDEKLGIWLRGPHSARRFLVVETLDLGLASLVAWQFVRTEPAQGGIIIAAAFAAILPDLLWGALHILTQKKWMIPVITPMLEKHHQWHEGLHAKKERAISFWAGLAIQGLICAALLLTIR